MKTYYHHKFFDDIIKSPHQDYTLSSSYEIIPSKTSEKIKNRLIRVLASGFAWVYSWIILRVQVIGKNKLKEVSGSYFVYANHTLILGDVFTPLTIFPVKNFYAIADQANWVIAFIGKHLVRYAGLPVGKSLK